MQPKNIYPGAWTLAGHHATGANETFATTGNDVDFRATRVRLQSLIGRSRFGGSGTCRL
jgi:hypothetical protein